MTLDLLLSTEKATWAVINEGDKEESASLCETASEVCLVNREDDEKDVKKTPNILPDQKVVSILRGKILGY